MASQQLILRTDKRITPQPTGPGGWTTPPSGLVFPNLTGPITDGDYYKWTLDLDFDGPATQEVQNNFFSYGYGWDCIFSPFKGNKPDGMYFFFGLNPYLRLLNLGTAQTIFIGRGKSGNDNPWWVGGGAFTVSGDHKSGTMTYTGNYYCSNAKSIDISCSGNIAEIDFTVSKYITS